MRRSGGTTFTLCQGVWLCVCVCEARCRDPHLSVGRQVAPRAGVVASAAAVKGEGPLRTSCDLLDTASPPVQPLVRYKDARPSLDEQTRTDHQHHNVDQGCVHPRPGGTGSRRRPRLLPDSYKHSRRWSCGLYTREDGEGLWRPQQHFRVLQDHRRATLERARVHLALQQRRLRLRRRRSRRRPCRGLHRWPRSGCRSGCGCCPCRGLHCSCPSCRSCPCRGLHCSRPSCRCSTRIRLRRPHRRCCARSSLHCCCGSSRHVRCQDGVCRSSPRLRRPHCCCGSCSCLHCCCSGRHLRVSHCCRISCNRVHRRRPCSHLRFPHCCYISSNSLHCRSSGRHLRRPHSVRSSCRSLHCRRPRRDVCRPHRLCSPSCGVYRICPGSHLRCTYRRRCTGSYVRCCCSGSDVRHSYSVCCSCRSVHCQCPRSDVRCPHSSRSPCCKLHCCSSGLRQHLLWSCSLLWPGIRGWILSRIRSSCYCPSCRDLLCPSRHIRCSHRYCSSRPRLQLWPDLRSWLLLRCPCCHCHLHVCRPRSRCRIPRTRILLRPGLRCTRYCTSPGLQFRPVVRSWIHLRRLCPCCHLHHQDRDDSACCHLHSFCSNCDLQWSNTVSFLLGGRSTTGHVLPRPNCAECCSSPPRQGTLVNVSPKKTHTVLPLSLALHTFFFVSLLQLSFWKARLNDFHFCKSPCNILFFSQ